MNTLVDQSLLTPSLIDSRLFRLPRHISVPLHPSETSLSPIIRSLFSSPEALPLRRFVGTAFDVDASQIFLGHRSSGLLALFLELITAVQGGHLRVGMPSYCCPAPLSAILSAECTPVFYELNSAFEISSTSQRAMNQTDIGALIVPSYFGKHRTPPYCAKKVGSTRRLIIRDDVHAFPAKYGDQDWDVALVSFHPSKRLPGLGGGAIVIRDPKLAELFQVKLIKHARWAGRLQSHSASRFMQPTRYLKDRVTSLNLYTKNLVSRHARRQTALPDALSAAQAQIRNCLRPQPMPLAWIKYMNTIRPKCTQLIARSGDYFSQLSKVVVQSLGVAALDYTQHLDGSPTHLVLRVDPQKRYMLGQRLADWGIESSWLYYPLHRLEQFAENYSELDFSHTDALAQSTLLIPFGAAHSRRQIEILGNALKQVSY